MDFKRENVENSGAASDKRPTDGQQIRQFGRSRRFTTSLLHVDISISKNNSIKQQNSKHFWKLKKTWNPFNWPIKWSHFREIFNNRKLLECSTTLLLGPSRSDEAFVRKFTKMRFGSERHLAPSRRFNGRLRSIASTYQVGPKELSIEHLKTNLMT